MRAIIWLLMGAALAGGTICRAEAPREKYRLARDAIAAASLRGAIGVLTLNHGVGRQGEYLRLHDRTEAGLVLRDTIHVVRETIPISTFAYDGDRRAGRLSNARYPVTGREGGGLEVVHDAASGARAWLRLEDLETDFHVEALLFAAIDSTCSHFADIFTLARGEPRRILAAPRPDAAFTLLERGEYPVPLLPLAVEGDYLRLARFDAETETTTPLGWLRLHDDDGLLTVWFIYVDLY